MNFKYTLHLVDGTRCVFASGASDEGSIAQLSDFLVTWPNNPDGELPIMAANGMTRLRHGDIVALNLEVTR